MRGSRPFPAGPSTPGTMGRSRRRCGRPPRKWGWTRRPEAFIPPTGFRVIPVLAWWRRPGPVAPVDTGEVAAVERVSLTELADPAARLMLRGPRGFILPAFQVRGMLIWGFTAALVDRLLAAGGWERPWDTAKVVDL